MRTLQASNSNYFRSIIDTFWLLWHRNFDENCYDSWDYGVAKKLKSTCGGKGACFSFHVSCPFRNIKAWLTKSLVTLVLSLFMNLSVCIFRLLFKKLIKFSGTFSNINTFVTLPADLSRHKTGFWSFVYTENFVWNRNSGTSGIFSEMKVSKTLMTIRASIK